MELKHVLRLAKHEWFLFKRSGSYRSIKHHVVNGTGHLLGGINQNCCHVRNPMVGPNLLKDKSVEGKLG